MTRKITAQRLMLREALDGCTPADTDAEIATHFVERHGYRGAITRTDRLQRSIHEAGQFAQNAAGYEAVHLIEVDDADVSGRVHDTHDGVTMFEDMMPSMRVVAIVLILAGVVLLGSAASWVFEKTQSGAAAYQGEHRG